MSPPPALGGAGGDPWELWEDHEVEPEPPKAEPQKRVVEGLCKRGHVYLDELQNGRCPKCDAGEPPPPPKAEHRRGFVPPPVFSFGAPARPA